MSTPRPPFHADHVGSLLRPASLHAAREKAARGEITPAQLRKAEDDAIREVVALQEGAGLQGITDGEFRRTFWHSDFLTGFDGIIATRANYAVSFKGEHGETSGTGSMMVVQDKVRRSHPIQVQDFAFLKSITTRTAKTCIPGPTYLHMRGGRNIVSRDAYPDMDAFWADIVAAYHAEIDGLVAAGCTYLQIDDVSFAYLCDASMHAQIRADGEDPAKLPAKYTQVINDIVSYRPDDLAVTMHTCRGNFRSMWMAEGGYEPVAEALFGHGNLDGFFLEYESERAGGFEPLRYMRKGTKVVLGLVSSKNPALESKDDLKRRIEEASRYVPIENLGISPQCGFASTVQGNDITEDVERRKLALLVEVANEVWGSAA